MSRVTSPAIDLTNFIFSSTDKTLRDPHLDDLLEIYYASLTSIIRAAGSNPDVLFPKTELHRQLRQFGIFGVVMAPLMIPLILADSSEISNLDELAIAMADGGDEADGAGLMAHLNAVKEQEFAQRMHDVLVDARRYGWIP